MSIKMGYLWCAFWVLFNGALAVINFCAGSYILFAVNLVSLGCCLMGSFFFYRAENIKLDMNIQSLQ